MRRELVALAVMLLALALSGCAEEETKQVSLGRALGSPVELAAGRSLGQSFKVTDAGLHRVDLYILTTQGQPPAAIFHLKESQQAEDDLATVYLDLSKASQQPVRAVFPPLLNSAGKVYYFEVRVEEHAEGLVNLILAQQPYPDGTAYQDGQPLAGHLLFDAYSLDRYTMARFLDDFLARASQDKPFFTFYLSLIGLVILALGFVLRWTPQRPDAE